MTSRPLFMRVDESTVILGPIDQVDGPGVLHGDVRQLARLPERRRSRSARSATRSGCWRWPPGTGGPRSARSRPARCDRRRAGRAARPRPAGDKRLRRPGQPLSAARVASVSRNPANPTTLLTQTSATSPAGPERRPRSGPRCRPAPSTTSAARSGRPPPRAWGRDRRPGRPAPGDDWAPMATTRTGRPARTTSMACADGPVDPAMATVVTATPLP
jgi:hypothetical protein